MPDATLCPTCGNAVPHGYKHRHQPQRGNFDVFEEVRDYSIPDSELKPVA